MRERGRVREREGEVGQKEGERRGTEKEGEE